MSPRKPWLPNIVSSRSCLHNWNKRIFWGHGKFSQSFKCQYMSAHIKTFHLIYYLIHLKFFLYIVEPKFSLWGWGDKILTLFVYLLWVLFSRISGFTRSANWFTPVVLDASYCLNCCCIHSSASCTIFSKSIWLKKISSSKISTGCNNPFTKSAM